MADSTSKGLFGLFGKKDDEQPSTDVFNNPSNAPAAVPLVTNVRAYYDTTTQAEQGLAPRHHESEPAAVPIHSGGQVEHPMYEQGTGHGFAGPAVVPTHETHVDPVKHGQEGGSDLMSKLQRSDSSSSYSSHEEGEEGKKEKKKGLKDKIKEKLPKGYKTADKRHHQADGGEKKHGLMDKIKEKLPGNKKEGGH